MRRATAATLALACTLSWAGDVQKKSDQSAIPISIDILPGEARNLVDPRGTDPVTVAVLGSGGLDVRALVPESLRLGGAPIVKDPGGDTYAMRDVNGDGFLDLVVRFAAHQIRVAEADGFAVLEATTRSGERLEGRDSVQTVASWLQSEGAGHDGSEEKLPPLAVGISLLPKEAAEGPVSLAVLSGDAVAGDHLSLASLRVNGHAITRTATGEMATSKDVDGDGRDDLVVAVPERALKSERLELSGVTIKGRSIFGETVNPAAIPPALIKPKAPEPADKARFPYVIAIPSAGPASQYPASVHVSGATGVISKIRVTLNGLLHPCFQDLDVLLVAPGGQSLVLMSDVGGCGAPLNATTLTFDDFAPTGLSQGASPAPQGSYRPANAGEGDPFPAPAPLPAGATSMSAFSGLDPNGEWKLYVFDDDAAAGGGQIREGWTLDLVTMTQFCSTAPVVIPDSGAAAPYPSTVEVAGVLPSIAQVSVTLHGLTHTYPDDLDVMLVSPGTPTPVMLMSDAGGSVPIENRHITFDDNGQTLGDEGGLLDVAAFRPADYQTGDVLPAPAPAGPSSTRLDSLQGTPANGTWRLFVHDDAGGDSGIIAGGWCLNLTTLVPAESCQTFPVTIPEGAPANTSGPASPYPVSMNITGTSGIPTSAEIRLLGLSHTFPDDLDVLMVTPFGRSFVLMSDAGGSDDVTGLDVVFSTTAAAPAPDGGPLGPGPYRPTDFEAGDVLPSPAPSGPHATAFPVTPANGPWELYVHDDAGADVGEIADGWCLNLKLDAPGMYCSAGPMALVESPSLSIPAGAPGTTIGHAFPYPSRVYVPEEGAVPGHMRLHLRGFTHTYPDDVDVLLVGPRGQKAVVLSDVGGSGDVSNLNIVLDDLAPFPPLPDAGPLTSGTFQPRDFEADAPFPAPAPPGPYTSSSILTFSQIDPKGYWDLYVVDDAGSDVGALASWCLEFVPLYPPTEVPNLRWPTRTTLAWDVPATGHEFTVLYGGPSVLGNLLTAAPESCPATAVSELFLPGLTTDPAPGSFFWYVVVARNWGSPYGPAGTARVAGTDRARVIDLGSCGIP